MVQKIISEISRFIAVWLIPSVVLIVLIFVFLQDSSYSTKSGSILSIAAWEDESILGDADLKKAKSFLDKSSVVAHADTSLSTNPYWFSVSTLLRQDGSNWAIEFPSRHALSLICWDKGSGAEVGSANRSVLSGAFSKIRAGFYIPYKANQGQVDLICKGKFEGPARISSYLWREDDLVSYQSNYERTGALIEGGVGILALFMLFTAIVNRSELYYVFFAWIALSMRMASLSAGTDFYFIGLKVDPDFLTESRQWTVVLYYSISILLFSQLFKDDLIKLNSGWLLTSQKVFSLIIFPICIFSSFQEILPIVWMATSVSILIMFYYIVKILMRCRSRVALWYSLSIMVSISANLNEVIAASTGLRNLLGGLNSVTSAIGSALLASVAVAEHMRSERLIKIAAQESLKAAYRDSPVGLFTIDKNNKIVKNNSLFLSMLGISSASEINFVSDVFEYHVSFEIDQIRKSKSKAPIDLQTRIINKKLSHGYSNKPDSDQFFSIRASTADGELIEASLQDVTEKVRAMMRLEFLASHDPLTDCLNLRGLSDNLKKSNPENELPVALAYFDLDRFKVINDLYGHSAGDEVLRQVCKRMISQIGQNDLLARVGGDEFVIAFPTSSIEEAEDVCQRVVSLISGKSYVIDTQSFALSISCGLVETESFGTPTIKNLVSTADTVCRMIKKNPTDRLRVIQRGASFIKNHKDELEIISSLESGIAPEGLYLVMQPEMSLHAPFDSLNFEVLLRLRKSNGDEIPAYVIINAAEAHGKSAIIDRWVVTHVIEWLEAHAHQLPNTQFVGVNLSGGSLNDETFIEELFTLFAQHKAALSLICLEITETVALIDINNIQRFISRARAMGIKVAMDDFGAGFSSFDYLKNLSIDALKLDGSLVKGCSKNPASAVIIHALGGLVKDLGLKSIGEFAEDLPTIQVLALAGIDYAQGWGISKAVMPERILAARSCVDLIEDQAVVEFAKNLQSKILYGSPVNSDFYSETDQVIIH